MFKKIFQVIFLFNISLLAQEDKDYMEVDNSKENKIPQEKESKINSTEKESEKQENAENEETSENSMQQEEDLQNEKFKESDFDDNVDISLFNKNKARNFFVVSPFGIGLNGLLFSKGTWWHNGFSSLNLFTNFCENIKTYKHKMLFNNYNISFDIFQYNIIIGKGFTYFVGLNFMWKHFLFLQKDKICFKYLSIYNNTQELNTLVKNKNPTNKLSPNPAPNPNPKDKNQERREKLQKESEEYYAKTDKDCNKEVYSISLFNIGLLTGLAWYSNPLNLKKSWFLKILLYARYQSVKKFLVKNNENFEEIESKYLRIRPFDLTCGLEIGRGKVSFLFFMSILPLLNENKKYDNNKEEGGEQKKEYKSPDNLFNCGVILKVNIF